MKIDIYHGHALRSLRKLPDNSVDCVVTSPPYWGLRDYGIKRVIFGGKKNCEHDWVEERAGLVHENRNNLKGSQEKVAGKTGTSYIKKFNDSTSLSCKKCGAWKGQLGLEQSFKEYVKHLCDIFDEVKRVLKPTGTCFVNLGDTYGGSGNSSGHTDKTKNCGKKTAEYGASKGNQSSTKGLEKCLLMIPSRFALEMIDRGWTLRNEVIWHKPAVMPSPVDDRFTVDFEKVFLFVKSKQYYFEQQLEPLKTSSLQRNKYEWNSKQRTHSPTEKRGEDNRAKGKMLKEDGRNMRCVWEINTEAFADAHFATFPKALIEPMIKAGSSSKGCCPKCGKPFEPIIEKPNPSDRPLRSGKSKTNTKELHISNGWGGYPKSAGQKYQEWKNDNPNVITGWKQSCECKIKNPVPCTVLDPFFGSGTTGIVAVSLGRDCIGTELNEKYIDIANKRILKEAGMLCELNIIRKKK